MTQTAKHRALRIAAYLFLMASAAAAFLLGDWLRAAARVGEVPNWAPLVPPSIFTLFVVVYAGDRWLLVKRRQNTLGRAFLQIAFAITFVSLLWLWPYQAPAGAADGDVDLDYRAALLQHRDPNVRAAACELLALRQTTGAIERIAALAAEDPSPLPRQACAHALLQLRAQSPTAGDDDGPDDDGDAPAEAGAGDAAPEDAPGEPGVP